MKDKDSAYILSEHFAYRSLPNGKVRAFNSQSKQMVEIEPWAGAIWELLKKKKTLAELQKDLRKLDPDLSSKVLSQFLPPFINDCLKLNFIESLPRKNKSSN